MIKGSWLHRKTSSEIGKWPSKIAADHHLILGHDMSWDGCSMYICILLLFD